MDEWFRKLSVGGALPLNAARNLNENGFVVLPALLPAEQAERLSRAYDTAVASADDADVRKGKTTTRVNDFFNRGVEFSDLIALPPLLEACCHIVGQPFKLSSMHARTLRPASAAQELHVDVPRQSPDWPLTGFIFMVDEFRRDNGATRFVPGSHRWTQAPKDIMSDVYADHDGQILACGPAGSLLIFNGSTWHGHTANTSNQPRRSLQGAFIPRNGRAGTAFSSRMRPDTRMRLGPLAHYLLQL